MTSGVPCSILARYPAKHAYHVRVDNVGVHIVGDLQIDAERLQRAVCFLEFLGTSYPTTLSEPFGLSPGISGISRFRHVVRQMHEPSHPHVPPEP